MENELVELREKIVFRGRWSPTNSCQDHAKLPLRPNYSRANSSTSHVRCREDMASHMLQGIAGSTFSTSPSPRRHWLTVSRGPEVYSSHA